MDADELDGLCYAVGEGRRADIYAPEYCYANGVDAHGGDDFGRSRDELCSVMRSFEVCNAEKCGDNGYVNKNLTDNLIIYKLHVRGFTKLENGGSFRALAGKAAYIHMSLG